VKTLIKQLLALGLVAFGFYAFTHWPRLHEVATGQTPEYPELRARDYGASLESVERAVKHLMEGPGWEVTGEAKGPVGIDIQGVHTHRLLRLKDDVTVTLRRVKGRTVVNVRSRSRLDAPDLGRNADNVRELLAALDREVF
jgi:Protein of unknown function (DUF1499)